MVNFFLFQIEVCVPDDFVVGHSKCGRSDSVISKKKLWFVAGTAITAFLICHLKASYKKL